MKFPAKITFIVLALATFMLLGWSATQEKVLRVDHKRFYDPGETINIYEVLNLAQYQGGVVKSVTVTYDAALGGKSLDWSAGRRAFNPTALPTGRGKSVTIALNQAVTKDAPILARLVAERGRIRVTRISANIIPARTEIAEKAQIQTKIQPPTQEAVIDKEAVEHAVAIFRVLDKKTPGFGWVAQGAGIAVTNIDHNPRPDLIIAAYNNRPQDNNFSYKIAFNLDPNGNPARWSGTLNIRGAGWEGQGAGLAVANIDNNPRPEIFLMAYDNPAEANSFRYHVGFNLDQTGRTGVWKYDNQVQGVGWEGQGADLLVTHIDNNTTPDLVLMAYDNPAETNKFRYKVGWNIDSKGTTKSWSGYKETNGVGWEGQGAGLAVLHADNNDQPDLLLMAYDNPEGANNFRYRIAYNLSSSGVAAGVSSDFSLPGVGWEGMGAAAAVANLDSDPRPELFVLAYDTGGSGQSEFRHKIFYNRIDSKRLFLEVDRLAGLDWFPQTVNEGGINYTLPSIYAAAGIDLEYQFDDGNIPDAKSGGSYSFAEIDSLRQAHMDEAPADPNTWHVHCAIVTSHADGWAGYMYDSADREGFVLFDDDLGNDDFIRLRITAHELGHALNLEHSDGDLWTPPSTVGNGGSIMNYGRGYLGWSAASLHHFYFHPLGRWRPGSGITFTKCH